MRAIDYLSVFFLLGAAPAWQVGLDALSSGLGSTLLVTLLIGAIHASRADTGCRVSVGAKTRGQRRS